MSYVQNLSWRNTLKGVQCLDVLQSPSRRWGTAGNLAHHVWIDMQRSRQSFARACSTPVPTALLAIVHVNLVFYSSTRSITCHCAPAAVATQHQPNSAAESAEDFCSSSNSTSYSTTVQQLFPNTTTTTTTTITLTDVHLQAHEHNCAWCALLHLPHPALYLHTPFAQSLPQGIPAATEQTCIDRISCPAARYTVPLMQTHSQLAAMLQSQPAVGTTHQLLCGITSCLRKGHAFLLLLCRQLHVVCQAQLFHSPHQAPCHVHLPPLQAMARTELKRMVIVVPAFAKRQQANPPAMQQQYSNKSVL